uniref:Ninein-like protein n=1 Tax=Callorhinchus milii TaxID=7868 RepID=A0A4W3H5Z1_CALMI|eukprot:gi/632953664/ref/XP_007892547.1/ PREDICTED: ninein-like protein isoform X1 [Callorhinchus milii]
MDESEQNKYVSQLKEVFNSCDTTGTGYLDKEELTELCRKLHLEAQLPLLLQSLLGVDLYARVNFEEFKEGFVAVLSTSIDLSTSGDESSYLEPMVPEEVQPKYVKGSKRYGRRSVPEFLDSEVETTGDLEEPVPFKTAKAEPGLQGTSRSQLRRSTSLESVESLKSDEEAESNKEPPHETFEAQGQMSMWNPDGFDSPTRSSTPYPDATENHVQAIWKELGVGKSGFLNKQELATVCDNIGLKDLDGEEVDDLFKKLDKDCDGKVSLNEFLHGLFRHGPQELAASSSSYKQKYRRALHQAFDESGCRTATPSFISNLVGSRLFSSLDDGTGYVSPEQVVNIWQEDGIKSSQEILQTLDFNMEEKVNLTELTIALDNELLVSNNGIYQAALSSYKNEIGYLQGQVEQSNKERDKIKSDLDRAEKRNLQLAREVDDHHTTMELLNESKFKDLDQEYKDKVAAVKTEMDKEQELVVQQVNKQRAKLEQEVDSLRSEEILLRDRLNLAIKENGRLEKEVGEVVEKLRNSEKLVCRLQKDLDYVLKEKFGTLDLPSTEYFGQEERFAEIVKEYEQQCRELRDQNDELQSEVEILRSQLHERKNHRTRNVRDKSVRVRADGRITTSQSDSAQTSGSPDVSIEAEMAIEQLRDQHKQEVQDLKIQLETKVNYYEREVELMKRGFEKERRDIEQSFKIEISELEEQMERLQGLVSDLRNQQKEAEAKHQDIVSELQREREEERTNPKEELGKNHEKNLRMNTEELKMSLLRSGGLSNRSQADAETRLRLQELEKAFSLERTDMEEQFAKEISEREQKLVNEKEQLEKDLMNQHQQELNKLRKSMQDELNQRLSLLEAQRVANHDIVIQKYQSENTELMQIYQRESKELVNQHREEKRRWDSRIQAICTEAKKERLNLQEKMNQEQAEICNTFTKEKGEMETQYKEQIRRLHTEMESLKTQVKEMKMVCIAEEETHQKTRLDLQENERAPEEVRQEICTPLYMTDEDGSSIVMKEEEADRLALQQQRDEMEAKLRQVMENSIREKNLLEHEVVRLQCLGSELERRCEAEKKYRYESKMLAEENLSLKRKLERIHMEFQDLDRERSKQRKQMEQLKGEKDRAEEEAKGLENVNDQSKAEMAELRSRILHLSSENSQFSAKLETSQNAIQLLNNRLAEHSQQTEEPVVSAKLLQATSCQREQEQQSIWEEKMELMEKELGIMREKVLEQSSQASEAGALRAEKEDLERRCQTLTQHFQETKEKTKDLEAALEGAHSEADHLKSVLTATQLDTLSLTQEMGSLRKALQEDRDKMSRMHILESELEAVRQECQTVQSTRVQLEAALVEIQEQLLDTKARLMLAKSQHVSQEQQLKEHISTAVSKDQLVQLQIKLSEEKERATQLQEQLDTQTQEANKLMFEQQVEYEQLLKRMEERMEQVEYKLKGVRIILREKMNQLKEQLTKNTKSDLLLKDLYLENSQLMKALQVTEHRQKSAEKNNFLLDEKIAALNKLIRKIAPMSLS